VDPFNAGYLASCLFEPVSPYGYKQRCWVPGYGTKLEQQVLQECVVELGLQKPGFGSFKLDPILLFVDCERRSMMKENSSFQILGFVFMKRLPWIWCWFLLRAKAASSPFMKSFGRWRLTRNSLLPSHREVGASLATPALISYGTAGSIWCRTASPSFPLSSSPLLLPRSPSGWGGGGGVSRQHEMYARTASRVWLLLPR
jgi:hypothetical protein